jgi:phage minor structural protein
LPDLYIFDPSDKLLAILSNTADDACPFWSAPYKEELNKGSTFEFVCPADHIDSQFIVAENQVAFKDKDGEFRLFVIKEPEDSDGENGPEIHAICEPAMLELVDEIIVSSQITNVTLSSALTTVLSGTRWQVGEVAELGTNSAAFTDSPVTAAITTVINTWGGEFRDRITVNETGITGRYIDILARRGADIGKVWEIDKDIVSIKRTIQSYPKTALYGRGQSTDDVKLTFANVTWSVSNGDPTDKPLGQEWVGDPEALQTFGRPNTDGTLRHRFGIFEDSEATDPAVLLQETWDALQEQKKQIDNFEMDVFLLEDITGYEHEKVRLGDTTFAIDRQFANPIEVEERVISFEYDVADPDGSGKVELGNFIDLFTDDERIDRIEVRLNNINPNPIVTDTSFPDTKPDVPANFSATGLFKTIMLDWEYDPSSFIASYELYASQVVNFTPDSSNLVWKGKSGGTNFKADLNQQWYFMLRAVNTHGTPSDFTAQLTAQTVQVNGSTEIKPLTITNKLIAEDAAIDFAKIANVVITNAMIDEAGIDFANIYDVVITNAMIQSLDASKITATSLSAISANLGTVTAGSITSNTTINIATDLYVGNTIYLGANIANTTKSIIFSGYARINTDGDFGLWVSSSTFRVDGSSTFQNNVAITGTNHLDFSSYGGGWYMQDSTWIRAVGNKNIYTPGTVKATTFDNTSLADYKENVTLFTDYALDSIASTNVYRYNYKKEYAPTNWQVRKTGFLYDEIHPYLQSGEDAIDLYGLTAFLWKGEQELYKAIKDLQTRVTTLEGSAA